MDVTLLRPAYHIQAYLTERGGKVEAAACIETRDLCRMLMAGEHGNEKANADGTRFVPIWWDTAATTYRG